MKSKFKDPEMRRLAAPAAAVALAALAAFFWLLENWRSAPEDATVAADAAAQTQAAPLEMSKRLSGPGVVPEMTGTGRGNLIWPLLAFLLPLGAGLWLGLRLARPARAETGPPVEAPLDGRSDTASDVAHEPALYTGEAAVPLEPADDDVFTTGSTASAYPDDTVATLRATIAARDEVIEALEQIVNENRELWGGYEESSDLGKKRVALLETELDAANEVIRNLEAELDELAQDRDAPPKPQVALR